MPATKRIPVSPETWQRIGRLKNAGQSYDNLLQRMMLAYNREELAAAAKAAREGKGTWTNLDDVA